MKNDGKFYWLGALLILLYILCLIGVILLAMHIGGTANAESVAHVKIVQARGGLNVREAPGIESKAVYLLEDTETVIVLEERNGWALVAKNLSKDMVLGWVCSDYLK